jgi:hypothetical protein
VARGHFGEQHVLAPRTAGGHQVLLFKANGRAIRRSPALACSGAGRPGSAASITLRLLGKAAARTWSISEEVWRGRLRKRARSADRCAPNPAVHAAMPWLTVASGIDRGTKWRRKRQLGRARQQHQAGAAPDRTGSLSSPAAARRRAVHRRYSWTCRWSATASARFTTCASSRARAHHEQDRTSRSSPIRTTLCSA